MNKIAYIQIIFENCDGITLPIDDFEYFYANNVELSMGLTDGYIDKYKTSGNVTISIKKQALDKQTDFTEMLTNPDEIEYHKLRNRINSSDITQLHFLDVDNHIVDSLYIEWADEDEWHNKYQTQEITGDEYLIININKEG